MNKVDLVGVAEIAEMLGVSRQRVHQLMDEHRDFPDSVAEISAGRIWLRKDVEGWIKLHPKRRPGRPPAQNEA